MTIYDRLRDALYSFSDALRSSGKRDTDDGGKNGEKRAGTFERLKRSYYAGDRETPEEAIEAAARRAARGENAGKTERNRISFEAAINDARAKREAKARKEEKAAERQEEAEARAEKAAAEKKKKKELNTPVDGTWSRHGSGVRHKGDDDRAQKPENGKDGPAEQAGNGTGFTRKSMEDLKKDIRGHKPESAKDDRDHYIQKYINDLRNSMNNSGTDELEVSSNGYNFRFVRIPDKDSAVEIQVNGKKAYVHEELTGDAVAKFGEKTEVSRDLVRRALDEMAEKGTAAWEKDLDSSARSVSVGMDLRAGRGKVVVNRDLKGGETRFIPGGPAISRDVWEECYGKMKESDRSRWSMTTKDGSTVECAYVIRINKEAAGIAKTALEEPDEEVTYDSPDFPDNGQGAWDLNEYSDEDIFGEDPDGETHDEEEPDIFYDEEAGVHCMSEKKWDGIYEKMMNSGKTYYTETLPDGTEVTAELMVKVNGMNRKAAIRDDLAPGTVSPEAQARTEISGETWEKAREQMLSDPQGKGSVILDDGTKLTGTMNLFVDGEKAYVNNPMKDGSIRDEKDCYVIPEAMYKDMLDRMDREDMTILVEKLPDGRTIKLKREEAGFELHTTEPDGKELVFRGEEMKEAIGVAFDADKSEKDKLLDSFTKTMADGAMTGMARRGTMALITAPGRAVKGMSNDVEGGWHEFGAALNAVRGLLQAGITIGR